MTNPIDTTSPEGETVTFHLLREGIAPKLGRRSAGSCIGYRILSNTRQKELYLQITRNDGGGHHGLHLIAFSQLQATVEHADNEAGFPARLFRQALVSRSANDPGFVCCLLRAESLLSGIPERQHLHRQIGDWAAWAAAQLALPGEAIDIPAKLATAALPADSDGPEPKPSRREKRKHVAHEGVSHAEAEPAG